MDECCALFTLVKLGDEDVATSILRSFMVALFPLSMCTLGPIHEHVSPTHEHPVTNVLVAVESRGKHHFSSTNNELDCVPHAFAQVPKFYFGSHFFRNTASVRAKLTEGLSQVRPSISALSVPA